MSDKIFNWVIILLISCSVTFMLFNYDWDKNRIPTREENFCRDGLTIGKGIINYCQGKAFVCSGDNCYYVENKQDDCWEECTMIMAGKVPINSCHEVCE